jgi:hypothetical protein
MNNNGEFSVFFFFSNGHIPKGTVFGSVEKRSPVLRSQEKQQAMGRA